MFPTNPSQSIDSGILRRSDTQKEKAKGIEEGEDKIESIKVRCDGSMKGRFSTRPSLCHVTMGI
jgi:hypothetical protein